MTGLNNGEELPRMENGHSDYRLVLHKIVTVVCQERTDQTLTVTGQQEEPRASENNNGCSPQNSPVGEGNIVEESDQSGTLGKAFAASLEYLEHVNEILEYATEDCWMDSNRRNLDFLGNNSWRLHINSNLPLWKPPV
ncbi:hypothetical protein chiPu_0009047 [Chiloscyllium punctatum]|uniref:Uncharacterized protein n=1 Tax=Chiloscyllium punctatum TaxID=137246 RepID=A0A401SJK6_CHIPU|nr:hypothetical protein [Chiloscyllium punctatum]